jgi:hypothetical protein
MTLKRRGKYAYGEDVSDLRAEMARYSKRNGYPIDAFWQPVCACHESASKSAADEGSFMIEYDDEEGAAWLLCSKCDRNYPVADSAEFEPQSVSGCQCEHDEEYGQVLVGAALFPGTDDVRWLYVGWRAPSCGLVGVYVDWKYDGSMTWTEIRERWGRSTSEGSRFTTVFTPS